MIRRAKCRIQACAKPVHCKGLCTLHYQQWRRLSSTNRSAAFDKFIDHAALILARQVMTRKGRKRPPKLCVNCRREPRLSLGRCKVCLRDLPLADKARLQRLTHYEREIEFAGFAAVKPAVVIPKWEYDPGREEELAAQYGGNEALQQ